MTYHLSLVDDSDDQTTLIDTYEIDVHLYDDICELVELWQETHPKPAAPPAPPIGCSVCMAAHRYALAAVKVICS